MPKIQSRPASASSGKTATRAGAFYPEWFVPPGHKKTLKHYTHRHISPIHESQFQENYPFFHNGDIRQRIKPGAKDVYHHGIIHFLLYATHIAVSYIPGRYAKG
jgi:hypothetical protein